MKKVYTTTSFTGFNPVGVSALVVATSQEEAARFLNIVLLDKGLVGDAVASGMIEVPTERSFVLILQDGED